MSRVGVVVLPMIFGQSRSFKAHARSLENEGFSVAVVGIYEGKPPFFLPYVAGPAATPERRNALANSINDDSIANQIAKAVHQLRDSGCEKVVVMGFGYGGVQALKNPADGVIAWYPHLVNPEGITKPEPQLERLACPVLLFFGDNDNETPGSLEKAMQLAAFHTNLRVNAFHAGHAFADYAVQGSFPSLKYRRKAAKASWATALQWLHGLA